MCRFLLEVLCVYKFILIEKFIKYNKIIIRVVMLNILIFICRLIFYNIFVMFYFVIIYIYIYFYHVVK